jgi:hypothetical protein
MAKKFDAKAKAKRQKIIAAVLGVLLLGVLAYEVPSLMKTMNKKPPATPAAVATPAPAAPAAAAPAAGTPVSAAVTGSGTLTDSDPAPLAGAGQLLSFDRFATKDPFVQQAGLPTAASTPAAGHAPASVANPPPPPPPAAKQPSASRTSARISVNGTAEDVNVKATFPAADPVFVLVSLRNTSAKVGIAGGSLSTGTSTVTLLMGKKVTLMNTADGTRYDLLLVSVS